MAKERTGESTSLWTGLATGLAVAAGIGVIGIIFYLLQRSRTEATQATALLGQGYPPPPPPQMIPYPVYMNGGGAMSAPPQPMPGAGVVAIDGAYRPNSMANTRRLPSLGAAGSQAIRVAGNDQMPIEAHVRAMGPPGSFATLSFSASELNTPGLGATIPNGYNYTIPAGEQQRIPLNRAQALYAKGNVDGVQLSVLSNMIPEVG